MSFGLTSAGFGPKRAADVLNSLRQRIVDELDARGLPTDVDFERDTVAGVMTDALAVVIGECWEASASIYDAFDPSSASFAQLDNIGALRAIRRLPAAASRAVVNLDGTASTIVPAGSIVQGGGPTGEARWTTIADVTLTGSPDPVEVVCTEVGATTAGVGAIDQIVSPISGWASVTNPAVATPGRLEEQDGPYRLRQRRDLRPVGGRSVGAIRQALLEIDGVQSVSVLENRTGAPVTIGTKNLDSHSILPIIFPGSLTPSSQEQVALALWSWGPAGNRVGYSGGTDNDVDILGDGFGTTNIGWDDATSVSVDVNVTLVMEAGASTADAIPQVESAIEALFEVLDVGNAVRMIQVFRAIAEVQGVAGATLTLDGNTVDIVVDTDELAVLGTMAVA